MNTRPESGEGPTVARCRNSRLEYDLSCISAAWGVRRPGLIRSHIKTQYRGQRGSKLHVLSILDFRQHPSPLKFTAHPSDL